MAINYKKGKIVKIIDDKTISVVVDSVVSHPKYKKTIRRQKKFLVHYEEKNLKVGDVVEMKLCRPISKNKCWIIVDNKK